MRLANKVAVITGAGSGMGKAMAQLFVSEGAKVVRADRSGAERETAALLGDASIAVHADVAVTKDVRSMIDTAVQHFGRLDILCNNAGFGGPIKPLCEQSEENFDTVLAVNLKGVFRGMKSALRRCCIRAADRWSTRHPPRGSSAGRGMACMPPPRGCHSNDEVRGAGLCGARHSGERVLPGHHLDRLGQSLGAARDTAARSTNATRHTDESVGPGHGVGLRRAFSGVR
jgi:hypothetical protein